MNSNIPHLPLNDGGKIPQLGYGTSGVKGDKVKIVEDALKAGYRHFDCAYFYCNQMEIGEVIKKSGVAREELFITSKVWRSHMTG